MTNLKEYFGELLGTFILVFIGCGTVGVAILFGTFTSLFQVALVWGLGVALAIYATRKICPAHLNPAVSLAMMLAGMLNKNKLLFFILFQFIGAFLAGGLLFLLLNDSIDHYEAIHRIVRGSADSVNTAMMFGEFFPNPGYKETIQLSWIQAMFWEAFGTFILLMVIFIIGKTKGKIDSIAPLLIGATITLLICIVAPYTQAGLNPARDFGPRLVAYLSGWGDAAFPPESGSFFTVYVLGPIFGSIAAYAIKRFAIR